jgi:RNA polymerase II subunit A-like phosphatase
MAVSVQESKRLAQDDATRVHKLKKLSLVLDLDHTLVHATNDIRARQLALQRTDVRSLILPVVVMNDVPPPYPTNQNQNQNNQNQVLYNMTHYIKLRPFVKEFLMGTCQELFEISVYTAGTRLYAEQIT